MNLNLPSTKTLETIADPDAARKVRKLLELYRAWPNTSEGFSNLKDYIAVEAPHTWHWAFVQCYHRPQAYELVIAAANELLGLHGVEAVEDRNGRVVLEYCNTGDTYAPTLIYNLTRRTFSVGSWGDYVERHPHFA